jgi:ribosomal protein S18 acetylase RimI-like enzyme
VAAVRRVRDLSRRRCWEVFERPFSVARMAGDYLVLYRRLTEAPSTARGGKTRVVSGGRGAPAGWGERPATGPGRHARAGPPGRGRCNGTGGEKAMNQLATLGPARIVPRRLGAGDRPQVLALAAQTHAPPWLEDLGMVLGARETMGWVTEGEGRVIGFAVCRLSCPDAVPGNSTLRRLAHLLHLGMEHKAPYLEATLLDLRVAPEWAGALVERTLLAQLDADLRQAAEQVEVVVPESCLTVQLFLRDDGYRATEILHGHYGTEDGYRMAWQPS